MNFKHIMLFFLLQLAICSCSKGDSQNVYADKRDNIEKAEFVAIDDSSLIVNRSAELLIIGDTLLVRENRSTDYILMVVDLNTQKLIGKFGKVGNGPGELANCGGMFFNPRDSMVCVLNYSKWQIDGFPIREALANPDYLGQRLLRFTADSGSNTMQHPFMVDDSTIVCMKYAFNTATRKFTPIIGEFNIVSGEGKTLEKNADERSTGRSMVFVPESGFIYIADRHNDRIQKFDRDGNLLLTVYGSDYDDSFDNRNDAFGSITFGDGKLFATYRNPNDKQAGIIHVFDADCKYLKTLRLDKRVIFIAFHKPTKRLYLNVDAEPQFGYIQL
ncbi:MAG: hypothetical protein NC131_20610 [Roseburia sp.]|nr:hypothetical protein [Roseburia sp.]